MAYEPEKNAEQFMLHTNESFITICSNMYIFIYIGILIEDYF